MRRFLAFIIVLALTPPAYGEEVPDIWVHEAFSPEVNRSVSVMLTDGATGGCWTNLKEVREYAEGKLQEIGFEVVEVGVAMLNFVVLVNSERSNGTCYGHAEVSGRLPAAPFIEGPEGEWIVGVALHQGGIFSGHNNANILVLDYIREAIEAIEASRD